MSFLGEKDEYFEYTEYVEWVVNEWLWIMTEQIE